MLDLETYGTRAGCAIRSIGAVVFSPYEPSKDGLSPVFYRNVTRVSCTKSRLHVDPDTEKWWTEQGEEARDVLEVNQVHLKTACLEFNTWFRQNEATHVWSHGAVFDIPIYECVAHAVGFKAPWAYNAGRDTRTLFELVGLKTKDVPFVGIKHNALDDAIHQAKCVQKAMQRLSEWKEQSEEYDEIKGMYGPS